jgi:Uma2 family endonuclease
MVAVLSDHRRRIKIAEYDLMVDAGMFQREPIELVYGELRQKHTGERRPIKRAEYDRMVELGLFQRERMELFRGELRTMTPVGVPHRNLVTALYRWFVERIATGSLEVCSQQPFMCADESELEPDLSIVPFEPHRRQHPSRAMLLIEVAESSRGFDLGEKAAIYARSDVAEYWVVDVAAEVVHVHRDRVDGRWTNIAIADRHQRLAPIEVPGVTVALDDLLPPPDAA